MTLEKANARIKVINRKILDLPIENIVRCEATSKRMDALLAELKSLELKVIIEG